MGLDGTVTLTVDDQTPVLYYYCEAHSGMGGVAALEAPVTGVAPPTPTGGWFLILRASLTMVTVPLRYGCGVPELRWCWPWSGDHD